MSHADGLEVDGASPTGLFLVSSVDDEGMAPGRFRLVRAPSRRAVAEAILADPYAWGDLLRPASLFEIAIRGGASYYEEPRPPSAEEFLAYVARSHVDGDSRSQFAILPVPEVLEVPRPAL